ncbi:hypothetical protein LTR95_014034, partial [Oleoguttula sp. CCFEE 5521]
EPQPKRHHLLAVRDFVRFTFSKRRWCRMFRTTTSRRVSSITFGSYDDDASSEIEDVPFQSSEANVEEAVANSFAYPQTSSLDQQGTWSGTDGTFCTSDESRPGGSVEEADHVETNANMAGEAEGKVQNVDEIEGYDPAERNEQAKQPDHTYHAAGGPEEHSRNNIEAGEEAESDAEANGDVLSCAAAEERGRATIQEDHTSQTAAPERHRTSSGTTRVSTRVMLPSQSRTAFIDKTPSPEAYIVQKQKVIGILSLAYQHASADASGTFMLLSAIAEQLEGRRSQASLAAWRDVTRRLRPLSHACIDM